MRENKKKESRFMKYIRRTYKNKLCALVLMVCGVVTLFATEGDITGLIFLTMISVPLFFARENWILE